MKSLTKNVSKTPPTTISSIVFDKATTPTIIFNNEIIKNARGTLSRSNQSISRIADTELRSIEMKKNTLINNSFQEIEKHTTNRVRFESEVLPLDILNLAEILIIFPFYLLSDYMQKQLLNIYGFHFITN